MLKAAPIMFTSKENPRTKRCKGCGRRKLRSAFYAAASNADGLQTLCKRCYLTQHEPVKDGTRTCVSCGEEKHVSHFVVQRTNKGGRSTRCKPCNATRQAVQRRKRLGRLPFVPIPGAARRRDDLGPYARSVCLICSEPYEPVRAKQQFCGSCAQLYRRIRSYLSNGRGKRRLTVSEATARDVARRYRAATNCVYCGRAFCADRLRVIDHRTPLCCGGTHDEPANLEICCADCNRCKAWLPVSEWLSLCRAVVIHADGGAL
jgi:hypothetical protein